MARAEKCISLISAKLGKSNYFCGDLPSSHDALVFGYLEIIIQLPFSSKCSLHEKLLSHQNLVDFCQRMRRMLFLKMKESEYLVFSTFFASLIVLLHPLLSPFSSSSSTLSPQGLQNASAVMDRKVAQMHHGSILQLCGCLWVLGW